MPPRAAAAAAHPLAEQRIQALADPVATNPPVIGRGARGHPVRACRYAKVDPIGAVGKDTSLTETQRAGRLAILKRELKLERAETTRKVRAAKRSVSLKKRKRNTRQANERKREALADEGKPIPARLFSPPHERRKRHPSDESGSAPESSSSASSDSSTESEEEKEPPRKRAKVASGAKAPLKKTAVKSGTPARKPSAPVAKESGAAPVESPPPVALPARTQRAIEREFDRTIASVNALRLAHPLVPGSETVKEIRKGVADRVLNPREGGFEGSVLVPHWWVKYGNHNRYP